MTQDINKSVSREELKRAADLEALWTWIKDQAGDACDIDGGDLQTKAVELGLWTLEKYDPSVHGEDLSDYIEPGDLMCVDQYAMAKRKDAHPPAQDSKA